MHSFFDRLLASPSPSACHSISCQCFFFFQILDFDLFISSYGCAAGLGGACAHFSLKIDVGKSVRNGRRKFMRDAEVNNKKY